jgi:hypothetical protein
MTEAIAVERRSQLGASFSTDGDQAGCRRSKALGLNFQLKPSKDLSSAKCASWMRHYTAPQLRIEIVDEKRTISRFVRWSLDRSGAKRPSRYLALNYLP